MFEDGEGRSGIGAAVNEEPIRMEDKLPDVKTGNKPSYAEELASLPKDDIIMCVKNLDAHTQVLSITHNFLLEQAKAATNKHVAMVWEELAQNLGLDKRQKELKEKRSGIPAETLDMTKSRLEKIGEWAQKNLEELGTKLGNPINKIKENKLGNAILEDLSAIVDLVKCLFKTIYTWIVNTLENFKATGDLAASVLNVIQKTGEVGKQGVIAGKAAARVVGEKIEGAADNVVAGGKYATKVLKERVGSASIIKAGV